MVWPSLVSQHLRENYWKICIHTRSSPLLLVLLADGPFAFSNALGVNKKTQTLFLKNEFCPEVFNKAVVWWKLENQKEGWDAQKGF